ncbi:MAG: hypothetical protein V1770_04405 [bacterium]
MEGKRIIEEPGRNTSKGARTEAKVFDHDGNEIISIRETSKTGSSWVDRFKIDPAVTYLLTVIDISNSGKNNSYSRVEGNDELSQIQQKIKKEFENKHSFGKEH